MKTWKVKLECGSASIGEVAIKRGIFQGYSLSPLMFVMCLIPLTMILRKSEPSYQFAKNREKINHLLYMDDLRLYAKTEKGLDSLMQTVRVFSADIGMEFGIDKCAMLVVKRGSVQRTEGVELPYEQTIKGLNEGDTYKYLGILQADKVSMLR